MRKLLMFAMIGLAAQLVDGAMGMAFGVTSTTLLIASGTGTAVASASVHMAEVVTALASGISHWRFGNVNGRVLVRLAGSGAVGGFVGATVLSNIDGARTAPFVSGVLLLVGAHLLARSIRPPRPHIGMVIADAPAGMLVPLGAVGGFVDAVGGGGWGPITTPALMTLGRMEPRRAVGTASAGEFAVALAASVGFLSQLGRSAVDLRLVLALAAGGVVIAPVAAALVRRLSPAALSGMVGGLIVVTNSRTIMHALEVGAAGRATVYVAVLGAAGAVVSHAWSRARFERLTSGRGGTDDAGEGSPATAAAALAR